MPMAKNEGRIGAKKAEFQLRKIELAHGCMIGIGLFVTHQNGLPSTGNAACSRERQFWRMPVGLEKCIDIAAVPGCTLVIENLGDDGLIGFAGPGMRTR